MSSTASVSLLPQRQVESSQHGASVLRTVLASATADASGCVFAAVAADTIGSGAALGALGTAAGLGRAAGAATGRDVASVRAFDAASTTAHAVGTSGRPVDAIGANDSAGPSLATVGETAGCALPPPAHRATEHASQHPGRAPSGASRWWGLLLPLAALAAAELAVRSGALPANQLPPPSAVAETIADLARNGLAQHITASTLRVLTGFAAGAVLAVLLGAAVGLSKRLAALLDPAFQALRAIPSLAWVPLLLLWLGIDEAPKLVLIAIGAFFPVYMGVASGIRDVDRKLIEVGRLYRLNGIQLARRVLLPAALPAILTGLRNGLSLAWMFMVAAELIAASKGLGYLLSDGRETSRADIVIAAIVLLAILGKISDGFMQTVETRLLHWRDSFGAEAAR